MKTKNKSDKLGMSYSTASQRLRKLILFKLIKKCGFDICYQCNEKIDNIDDLSIEHKIPWFNSETPKELFWDLENIAFSHINCNIVSYNKNKTCSDETKKKISLANTGRKMSEEQYIKMVARNKKICRTHEFKKKVSESMKRHHKDRKAKIHAP